MSSKILNIDQKRDFLSEHFFYEVVMVYESVLLLGKKGETSLNNMALETLALHSRILLEFFYEEKKRGDDSRAVDFYDEEIIWDSIKINIDDTRTLVNLRTNKEITHLTYKRINDGTPDKGWLMQKHTVNILKVCNLFIENLPNKYLSDNLRSLNNMIKIVLGKVIP